MNLLTNKDIERINALYFDAPRNADGKIESKTLSAITDEHAIEVAKMLGGYETYGDDIDWCIRNGKQIALHVGYGSAGFRIPYAFVYQQLILWGYDVPLYFGINHPCNGLTAIQVGIAIDKTTVK